MSTPEDFLKWVWIRRRWGYFPECTMLR